MRWPFAWRSTLDAERLRADSFEKLAAAERTIAVSIEGHLEAQRQFNAHLQVEIDKANADRAHLLDTILDLRVSGASAARLAPILRGERGGPRNVKADRSKTEQAIDENPRAKANPLLRRHLHRTAARMREEGKPEAAIELMMRSWNVVGENDEDDDDGEVVAI